MAAATASGGSRRDTSRVAGAFLFLFLFITLMFILGLLNTLKRQWQQWRQHHGQW